MATYVDPAIAQAVLDADAAALAAVAAQAYVPTVVDIGGFSTKIIHSVSTERYVFSKAFYNGTPTGMSLLEGVIKNYLTGVAIPASYLQIIVDDYNTWPKLEQYYYTPVLVHLLRLYLDGQLVTS